jgi:hypothetical protein
MRNQEIELGGGTFLRAFPVVKLGLEEWWLAIEEMLPDKLLGD